MNTPIVPNRTAELEAMIAKLQAEIAELGGAREQNTLGKPSIPLRALRRTKMIIGFRFPGDMP